MALYSGYYPRVSCAQLQAQAAELERLRALATRLAVSCRQALHLVEENNEEVVQMVGSFGLLSDLQSALAEARAAGVIP